MVERGGIGYKRGRLSLISAFFFRHSVSLPADMTVPRS